MQKQCLLREVPSALPMQMLCPRKEAPTILPHAHSVQLPDDDYDDDLFDHPAAAASFQAMPPPSVPSVAAPQAADMQSIQTMVLSLAQTAQQALTLVAQQHADLQKQSSERSSGSDTSSGFNLASKVLKYPEPFGTENAEQDALGWLAWRTT